MATLTRAKSNQIVVDLEVYEASALDDVLFSQLGQYITIWIREQSGAVLKDQISKLTPQELTNLFALIRSASSR